MNNTRPSLDTILQGLNEAKAKETISTIKKLKPKEWKVDYTAFIRPELIEVLHHHAKTNTLEHFHQVWSTPNLASLNGMVLVFTEFLHYKYGKILVDMVLLLPEEYRELQKRDPLLEFFDGEVEISFRQIVKKTVTEPYMIYLHTEGSPSSFLESDSLVSQTIRSSLERGKEGLETY